MSASEPKRDRRTVGRVLSDMLADRNLKQGEAVRIVNGVITPGKLSAVIAGKAPVTTRTACVLERITGRPAEEWMMHYLEKEIAVARASVTAEIEARAKQSVANAANNKAQKAG